MGWIKIEQPSIYYPDYFDYTSLWWLEEYDHTLVPCDCGNLMEKGVGLCEQCIERETLKMQSALEELTKQSQPSDQEAGRAQLTEADGDC